MYCKDPREEFLNYYSIVYNNWRFKFKIEDSIIANPMQLNFKSSLLFCLEVNGIFSALINGYFRKIS